MTEKILQYDGSSLHYEIAGTGAESLFFFHGFGQDRKAFELISQSLSHAYTFYIFDLYFHGNSQWGHGEQPLEKAHWNKTMEALLLVHKIEKFSLAGFSLGGKFALATLEAFPEKVQSILLLAPDGIKTSFWYSLATYPILLRALFKSMVIHPGRFRTISQTLDTIGVLDKGLIRFTDQQMNTEEKRRRVYMSWVVFRRLHFNMKTIASLINTHRIPLTILTGKYDKVIRSENMNRLLRHLTDYRHEILETGHNGLIGKSIPFLQASPH